MDSFPLGGINSILRMTEHSTLFKLKYYICSAVYPLTKISSSHLSLRVIAKWTRGNFLFLRFHFSVPFASSVMVYFEYMPAKFSRLFQMFLNLEYEKTR